MANKDEYAVRIFAQAVRGTPNNAGVPPALANIIVAQAKHETGNFSSRFFVQDHNGFGYSYYSGSPYQTGAGGVADNGQSIAQYATIEDSTKEIIDWLYRRMREGKFPDLRTITTIEEYAVRLKNAGYYGAPVTEYLAGLKRWIVPLTAGAGVTFIAAAAVIAYLYRKQLFS